MSRLFSHWMNTCQQNISIFFFYQTSLSHSCWEFLPTSHMVIAQLLIAKSFSSRPPKLSPLQIIDHNFQCFIKRAKVYPFLKTIQETDCEHKYLFMCFFMSAKKKTKIWGSIWSWRGQHSITVFISSLNNLLSSSLYLGNRCDDTNQNQWTGLTLCQTIFFPCHNFFFLDNIICLRQLPSSYLRSLQRENRNRKARQKLLYDKLVNIGFIEKRFSENELDSSHINVFSFAMTWPEGLQFLSRLE